MRHKFLVLSVKKWLKSVHIYGSYRKIKTGVPFFWNTRYMATCYPLSAGNSVTDCKMNDLELPCAAIWRQNPFSANTLLRHRCVFWSSLHKFEWR